ncbi:MAG: DUF2341 domain-containing protein [Deltaproteobacteria bacterium]|nr:DUF2341 domain-containing protein [Deltaproteobacteria bacterium]
MARTWTRRATGAGRAASALALIAGALAGCQGCQQAGAPCATSAQCLESEVCVEGICRQACNSDLDCLGRESCQSGACMPRGDAGAGDAGAGDAGAGDASAADRNDRDRLATDRAAPPEAGPDAAFVDGAAAGDLARPDTAAADRWRPDVSRPDATGDIAVLPDAWRPDLAEPDTTLPDTTLPDTGAADLPSPDAAGCWYHDALRMRWPLTIANPTAETIADFPVLLRLDCAVVACSLFGPNGADLRVADDSCQLLPHEIELWDTDGESLIWLRAPLIEPGGSSARIYLYGDVGTSPSILPLLPASDVWSNGYQGVYHLGAAVTDSSPLANHGTGSGSGTTDQVAGAVGLGRRFKGGQAIRLEDSQPLLQDVDGATVGLWLNLNPMATARQIVLGISVGSSTPTASSRMQLQESDSGVGNVTVRRLDSDPDEPLAVWSALTRGTFHHVVLRVRYREPRLYVYIDGVQTSSDALTHLSPGSTSDTPSRNAALGAQDDGSAPFLVGILDEVRFSGVARSAGWIALEYLSQQAPGIVSIGPAEAAP